MTRRLAALAVLLIASASGAAAQDLPLPPRDANAPTGSAFAAEISGLSLDERDARIAREILSGNVPSRLRSLRPVAMDSVTVWAAPDYLAVGSDADYLLVPMRPETAQRIADSLGMALPTPRMVDAIWAAADLRLPPAPIAPGPEMTTVPVFLAHTRTVAEQRRQRDGLIAGHKKDVVVSRALAERPGHVAIYGWHREDGMPIQPLYLGHTADWVDYSHGIRLVSATVRVGERALPLAEALRDPDLAPALSHEGAIETARYPLR